MQRRKHTIEDMQNLAKSKNGKFVSKTYKGSNDIHNWLCENNHNTKRTPREVKRWGFACGKCNTSIQGKKSTIENMQDLAKSKGGKCISKRYKGALLDLDWLCENGHKIRKCPSDFRRWGFACRRCRQDKQLKLIQDKAKELGGECLSKRFKTTSDKYKFRCKEGHIWGGVFSNILKNHWCPECAGNKPKSIREIRGYAKEKSGKLISKKYKGAHIKLLWECYNGHQFKMSPNDVHNNNHWCPECASGIGERITRVYFETIFQEKFPIIRPDWLIGKNGRKLELDGYCEKLKLAFEYQGLQHYETTNIYVTTKEALKNRIKTDNKKISECRKRGITLLQIPQRIGKQFNESEFKMFLKDIFIENGVTIPMNYDSIKIDIKKAYSYKLRGYYEELKKVVEDKGGKLISDYYLGNNIKLTYECNKGHRWEAVPFSIVLHNTWCPTCKGGIKYNIERVREIAKKRGDKCLSDDYKNSMSKLKFKCKNGHISETRFQYYKKLVEGTWCPECRPNIKRERDENGRFV